MPYLFLDLETTGLNPATDSILEVGWCFTDSRFHSLSDVDGAVVTTGPHTLNEMSPFIQDMHVESGLMRDLLKPETLLLEDIEQMILDDYQKYNPLDERTLLAGFSVHFDQSFVNVHMPRLAKLISYQVMDVTTLKKFFHGIAGYLPEAVNVHKHRADYDVVESLEVARAYRDYMIGVTNA